MGKKKKDDTAAEKTVSCNVDEKTFMRFALVDTYRLKKYWRGQLGLSLLVFIPAILCFIMADRKPHFPLLGGIFAVVGLLIPVFFFLVFKAAVQKRMKKFSLSRKNVLYRLTFGENGVTVYADGKKAECTWDFVSEAYRDRECIYLYLRNEKAYLLPQYNGDDGTWQILTQHLGEKAKILH